MIDGMSEDEYLAQLRAAIRQRLLDEVGKPRDVEKIVNNVYGSGGGVGGMMGEAYQGDAVAPEDRDYFVDIMREDLPEINEMTGKPKGWKKSVHRYAKKKDPMV